MTELILLLKIKQWKNGLMNFKIPEISIRQTLLRLYLENIGNRVIEDKIIKIKMAKNQKIKLLVIYLSMQKIMMVQLQNQKEITFSKEEATFLR